VTGRAPVGDAAAALEAIPSVGVGLVALNLLVGAEVGVRVGETHDEADRDQTILHVVEKRAAVGIGSERPARRVDDEAGPVLVRVDLPQLLEAEAVDLRVAVRTEPELLHELPAEVAAAAFGEEGVLAQQLDARLVLVGGLAVASDADIPRGDAAHAALFII